MFHILISVICMVSWIFLPFEAKASEGMVPLAAASITEKMDAQLLRRIGNSTYGKSSVSIVITTPVLLDNLSKSSPLARQLSEEMMHTFIQYGYRVIELRKGSDIIVDTKAGETILTRDSSSIGTSKIEAAAILAGTYTITEKNIRFNIKLLHVPTNDILAAASVTIPITTEIFPLLADRGSTPMPSVFTKIQ